MLLRHQLVYDYELYQISIHFPAFQHLASPLPILPYLSEKAQHLLDFFDRLKGPFSSAENGPFFPSLYFASSAYSGASAVAGAMAELVSLAHSSACSQNIRVMVDGCATALVAMAMSR